MVMLLYHSSNQHRIPPFLPLLYFFPSKVRFHSSLPSNHKLIFYKTLLRWLVHNWHWITSINKSVYLLKEMGQSKISLLSWSSWSFHGIRFPFKHLQAHSKMLLPWESCDHGSQINVIIGFYSFIITTF